MQQFKYNASGEFLRGVEAKYSKRMFLNTHDYSRLILATAVASYRWDYIRVRARALNTSSGGRCWEVSKSFRGSEHPRGRARRGIRFSDSQPGLAVSARLSLPLRRDVVKDSSPDISRRWYISDVSKHSQSSLLDVSVTAGYGRCDSAFLCGDMVAPRNTKCCIGLCVAYRPIRFLIIIFIRQRIGNIGNLQSSIM